jgi:hypothetical protein
MSRPLKILAGFVLGASLGIACHFAYKKLIFGSACLRAPFRLDDSIQPW